MDFDELTPDEKKRAQVEVRQDKAYVKSRNVLLMGSLVCFVALAAIGLLVAKGMMTMLQANVGITACVTIYLYCMIRMVQKRKHAEARWILRQAESRKKKKEKPRKTR